MRYIVYADVLFLYHAVTGFWILLMIQTILGHACRLIRTLAAAGLTALVSTGIFVITARLQGFYYILYATSYFFMTYFFVTKSEKKATLPSVLLVMLGVCVWFAGILTVFQVYAGKSFTNPYFYASCITAWVGCRGVRKFYDQSRLVRSVYEISLTLGDQTFCARGFLDTGNHLCHPYTKKPAVVISYRLLKPYVSSELWQELEKYHRTGQFAYTQKNKGDMLFFFPIPYRTISSRFTIMPALTLSRLTYEKEQISYTGVPAGISREPFFDDHFDVLLHEKLKP